MSSEITRQFSLIQEYDELNKANKHPLLALYNGKLIIYRKDPDSLIKRVQQAVSSLFYCLIGLLFRDRLVIDSNKIKSHVQKVTESHSKYWVEQITEEKTKRIEELNTEIGELTERKKQLSSEIGNYRFATSIELQVTQLQSDAIALQNDIRDLKNKKKELESTLNTLSSKIEAQKEKTEKPRGFIDDENTDNPIILSSSLPLYPYLAKISE